jgi:hypothetical protein
MIFGPVYHRTPAKAMNRGRDYFSLMAAEHLSPFAMRLGAAAAR